MRASGRGGAGPCTAGKAAGHLRIAHHWFRRASCRAPQIGDQAGEAAANRGVRRGIPPVRARSSCGTSSRRPGDRRHRRIGPRNCAQAALRRVMQAVALLRGDRCSWERRRIAQACSQLGRALDVAKLDDREAPADHGRHSTHRSAHRRRARAGYAQSDARRALAVAADRARSEPSRRPWASGSSGHSRWIDMVYAGADGEVGVHDRRP
jgi:hypothetical protein